MGAGFKDFASGAILTAGDVDNYLMRQTVMTFADASARDTALSAVLDEGMVAYLEDTDTVTVYDGSAWNAIGGGGKILQVVRATDSTNRTTTSTSYVDANISVTITPTLATSTLLIVWTASIGMTSVSNSVGYQRITTSAGVALSGADDSLVGASISSGVYIPTTLIGYAAPATTSAVTYKGQIAVSGSGSPSLTLRNSSSNTGQMLALEVGA